MRVRRELSAVEAVLEEMADAAVAPIRASSMVPVELLKAAGSCAFRRPQGDVVVVRHQTPCEDLPLVPRRRGRKLFAQAGAIRPIECDEAAVVAAGRHVVDGV